MTYNIFKQTNNILHIGIRFFQVLEKKWKINLMVFLFFNIKEKNQALKRYITKF